MSQTPPNGPQVPGGHPQQPPVPQQPAPGAPQYPQQGANPTQGFPQQPPGYPQQQMPQGYPQQQTPQPYPGQPGYQGQPAYRGQPAYQGQQPPQPYQPQGGYSGQPQPPSGRAPSSKILMIVIGAVLVLVLAGGVLLMMSNRSTPTVDPVTPTPTTLPTGTATATTQPTATTEPTTEPTGSTTEPTPEPQPNGLIDLADGVMFLPADGWEIQEQVPGGVSVGNGKAVVVTRVLQQKKDTNAGQLCDAYNRKILEESAGAKFGDPKDLTISLKNIHLAQCPATFVSSANGKSQQMLVVTFGAVRTSDGVATLTTMLFTKDTPETTFNDIDKMLSVVLTSQSVGG